MVKKHLLRIGEAAQWLQISERSVYRLINEGQIEIVKIRNSTRVFVEFLEIFLENELEKTRLDNGIPECQINSCPKFHDRS